MHIELTPGALLVQLRYTKIEQTLKQINNVIQKILIIFITIYLYLMMPL